MISHAYDAFTANSQIIKLSAKLHHNGPDTTTLRQLANLCELLALRLESFESTRLKHRPADMVFCGNRCKSIRERYNLTQERIAELSHLSQTVVCNIENGQRDPRLSKMLRMSFALKTPAAKLWPALNSVPSFISPQPQGAA